MAHSTDLVSPQLDVARLLDQAWPVTRWCQVHVAVALSGGCDSTALLRAIAVLKQRSGGRGAVMALHVDHQLRGEESDRDAQWCREFCQRLSLPLQSLRVEPEQLAAARGDGLEAAARDQRYRLLSAAAEAAGARYLATAHTRDDQVETILFRLLRGTGLRGLTGIPSSRPLTPSLTLVRPLLDCRRATLESYLHRFDQDYRHDSSNDDTQLARNKIRHELLPQLRAEFNGDLDAALLSLAAQAAEGHGRSESQARALLDRATITRQEDQLSIALPGGTSAEPTVRCEALRIVWRESGLPEVDMTRKWWLRLAALADAHPTSEVLNLPAGIRASNAAGTLHLQW